MILLITTSLTILLLLLPLVTQYAEAVRELSSENSLLLLDLWSGDNAIELTDLTDGLHFGIEGT